MGRPNDGLSKGVIDAGSLWERDMAGTGGGGKNYESGADAWLRLRRLRSWSGLLLSLWGLSGPALAYDFVPTEQEFRSWPNWCQALYLSTDIGKQSAFAGRMASQLVTQANQQHYGFWHHCAGLVWLARARAQPNEDRARWEYRQAINETAFNYIRSTPDHPHRAEMGTTLGLAHRGLGELDRAKEFLTKTLRERPTYGPAYTALYLLHRDEGNLDAARDVLLRGNEAVKGQSAEIHYFLGLLYVDLGDIAAAEKYAQQAYKLGYPLPGLRNKIERAKKSSE